MPAIPTEDRSKTLARTDTDVPGFDESLIAAFERVATTFPMNIALASAAWQPSYRELNATANRLAHQLIAGGGASEDRVTILMEHDTPAIGAHLGILKAGRIVVAFEPSDPVPRLQMLMEDAEPSVIVTDAENRELAGDIANSGCRVVTFEAETVAGPTHNPSIEISPEQTASLVYTSGATGHPKGVMYTHRQFRRNTAIHSEAMRYTETDRIPLLSAISTGQGQTGVWNALLNGATLCPFPVKKKGVTGLVDCIIDRRLTVYVSSASIFRALIKTIDKQLMFSNIRAVRLASEAVTADDVRLIRKHFPPASVFVHTLSTSETGNIAWSRWTKDDDIPEGIIPIGHVSRGIDVVFLGDDGQPVSHGEIGEIFVKSRYVAAGYWRDPALTAERFSENLDSRGTRLVRTGDRGRLNTSGHVEFCGRRDDRIKIRGNRIELTDIERALSRLPGIECAAAVAVPRGKHEPMLVGFVVMTTGASWSVSRLRHAVAANLPLHMVPSRFVFVDSLPFAPGGKVNRDALREFALLPHDDGLGEAPRTETETLLADIWSETLDLSRVNRGDDFFSLGGDSLTGAIVAAQIHSAFGADINLEAIADHPTVSALASFIDECRRVGIVGVPPIVQVPRTGSMPLSPFQERVWKVSETRTVDACARSFLIKGLLDVEILKECLRYLVERHEILRTSFNVMEGNPVQNIHSSAPLGFSFVDVSNAKNPGADAEFISIAEAARAINPGTLPNSRYFLIRICQDEHWLLRITHPLMQDGWSFAILMNELAALYEAKLHGMDPPIPKEMPLQYADYAVWHREVMQADNPAYTEMLAWWKQIFSNRARSTKLPFRRSSPQAGLDPSHGVIKWKLDDAVGERLDLFARSAGATHFIVRLACFVALVADMTGRSTVVIGTYFANRNRIATRNIVGLLTNLAPLVFSHNPKLSFRNWVEIVRDRVFETEARAELPFEELYEQLRAAGLRPPSVRILFAMSADLLEHRFGGLTLTRRPYPVGKMPWGCQVYIDEHVPENCRVDFDAGIYHREGMQWLIDRYLRLLEAAALQPGLPVGRLLGMSSHNPIRRKYAYSLTAAADFMKSRLTDAMVSKP